MKNNNGNPVPSLDNTIDWLLSLSVPQVFTHELQQDIIEKLEELQNGVETNKEYPEFTVSGKKRELVG